MSVVDGFKLANGVAVVALDEVIVFDEPTPRLWLAEVGLLD